MNYEMVLVFLLGMLTFGIIIISFLAPILEGKERSFVVCWLIFMLCLAVWTVTTLVIEY